MTDTVNTRRLALDVLVEVTEHGAYSNRQFFISAQRIPFRGLLGTTPQTRKERPDK